MWVMFLPGSPIKAKVFIWAGHTDTLCLARTKIPDSQEKSWRSA